MALSFQDKIKPISQLGTETGGLSFADKIQSVPEEQGFIQSIAQAIASPFLKFGATTFQLGEGIGTLGKAGVQALTGDKEGAKQTLTEGAELIEPGREFDFGYLGKVKSVSSAKEAIGTGVEIGGTILPIGEAGTIAKATLAGKIGQGALTGIKAGGVGGALTGAGQALQEDAGLGDTLLRAATGGVIGLAGGAVIGGLAPVAGKIYQKFAKPYEERIVDSVKKNFFKAIKPSTIGKVSSEATQRYEDNATKAITLITNNKDKLTLGEKVGVLPESVSELSDSISQAKREVFKVYNTFTKQAGKTGEQVPLIPIADELDKVANDIGLQDNFPQIAIYAEQKAQRLRARQFYDPETAEKVISEYNAALKSYYTNPTYEAASKVRIDALAVNRMRQSLDDLIERTTGAEYQELKHYYGALKVIEKDVARAAVRVANRNIKGIVDFSDILSAGDIIGGIATLDPTFFIKGLVQKGVASWFKQLNSPDALIKKMFQDVESNITKIKTGKIPPLLKAVGVAQEFVKNPKIGLSIEDVSKQNKITKQAGKLDDTMSDAEKGEVLEALKPSFGISKNLEPLAQEARKYKTAEEFVKGLDDKIVYRGSRKEPSAPLELGVSPIQKGKIFFTEHKQIAQKFTGKKKGGNLGEFYLDYKNPLEYGGGHQLTETQRKTLNEILASENPRQVADKYGYDAIVQFDDGGARTEIILFDTSLVKTKSQLTDFYNKVKNPK